MESKAADSLFCQAPSMLANSMKWEKSTMQTVVGTYGSFAFGYLHTGNPPNHAALILHNEVLLFQEKHGLTSEAILTDNKKKHYDKLPITMIESTWS